VSGEKCNALIKRSTQIRGKAVEGRPQTNTLRTTCWKAFDNLQFQPYQTQLTLDTHVTPLLQ